MSVVQQTITFSVEHEWLVGVVAKPETAAARGVLIVVGGPQYRVGSHRQFALLANHLALQGIVVMRFDYRGMGDSTGVPMDFERAGPDLRAAVDALFGAVPTLREVVLWGLCDAASASLFYAHCDPRVTGIVLLNPWVRTAQGEAQAYLRHYYLQRLTDAQLWRRIARGEWNVRSSIRSLAHYVLRALAPSRRSNLQHKADGHAPDQPGPSLPERMRLGWVRFQGPVLLILSGNDLTAQEFVDVTKASRDWRNLLAGSRVTQHTIPAATHTFSRRSWRDQVATWTADWLKSW